MSIRVQVEQEIESEKVDSPKPLDVVSDYDQEQKSNTSKKEDPVVPKLHLPE